MAPLAPENMTEEQKAAEELASGPRGEVRGPFNVLLRSPELMSPLQKVGEYLRYSASSTGASPKWRRSSPRASGRRTTNGARTIRSR